jgi:hypothetical protein
MGSRPFMICCAAEALLTVALALFAADINLHDRLQPVAGLNTRGFRGPLRLTPRTAGQHRLLIVGDASTFGFGVALDQSLPSYVGSLLTVRAGRTVDKYSMQVINAAAPPDGAYAMRYAVRDFAAFEPDLVLVDGGYDGLCRSCPANRSVMRHRSAIFRATGYWPIVPQYLEEKGVELRERSSAAAQALGRVVSAAGRLAYWVDGVPVPAAARATDEGIAGPDGRVEVAADPSCGSRWAEYCGAVAGAVDEALAQPWVRYVVVMTPPYLSEVHREQQRAMASMVAARYGAMARVRYLDAGEAVDLKDPAMTLGGGIRSARGNQDLGGQIVIGLLPLVQD